MKKTKSKMTRIFEHILNTPKLTPKALVTFICNMNGRDYQSGYYSNILSELRHRGRLYTNKRGYVKLTALGKKMINTPCAKTPQEKQQERERKLRYQIESELMHKLEKLENEKMERVIKRVDERGHIETIEELTYFLKMFKSYDEIELSTDEEGNAFGKIHNQVFYDELETYRNKVTLVPLVRH